MSSRRGARIAHIGIATTAFDELQPLFRDILGLTETPVRDMDGAHIIAFAAGDSLVELLESHRPGTPIANYLAKRGPGLHHVCFAVPDLNGALQRCRDAGLRLIDETPRMGAEGKLVAFLHPSSTGGVLVELTEE